MRATGRIRGECLFMINCIHIGIITPGICSPPEIDEESQEMVPEVRDRSQRFDGEIRSSVTRANRAESVGCPRWAKKLPSAMRRSSRSCSALWRSSPGMVLKNSQPRRVWGHSGHVRESSVGFSAECRVVLRFPEAGRDGRITKCGQPKHIHRVSRFELAGIQNARTMIQKKLVLWGMSVTLIIGWSIH